jgi:hypothetical protein
MPSSSASSVGHSSFSQRYSSPLATGVPTDQTRRPRRLPPTSARDTDSNSAVSWSRPLTATAVHGWRPDLPEACHEPFIPLLWVKVHELLGRVPEGSTARFVHDGTLPVDVQHSASVHRIAS